MAPAALMMVSTWPPKDGAVVTVRTAHSGSVMDDMPMLRPPGNSSEIPAVRHARIATARMFRRPWSVRRSGYTRRVALRPFRWAVKLNSGMVVSFLSLGFLALILPRNRPRRGGTEADQTRPSRWMVAAFRATVRPRADRYAQPQEHTACQPLRRSHPDS